MSGKRVAALIAGLLAVVLLTVGFVPAARNAVFGSPGKDRVVENVVNIPADKPKDLGHSVAVFGSTVPKAMKAEPIEADYPINKDQVIPLSEMVRITPEGKLPGKITLVFTLQKSLNIKDGALFVATRETGKDWTFIEPKASSDGTTASVEVDHLSDWWMFFVDPAKFLGKTLKQYLTDLFLKPFAGPDIPPCPKDQSQRATTDNYTVKQSGDAVAGCFARKDDKSPRTMTITNKRRYPLEVKHPGFQVEDAGRFQAEFSNLARAFSGKESILFSHATIKYSVELEMGKSAKLSTAYSGMTANFVRMDMALQSLVYIVGKLNVKFVTSFDDHMMAMDKLLSNVECANAFVKGDFGALINKCFTTRVLTAIYGTSAGIVMGGLAAVTSFVTWLTSEFSSLNDMLRGRDKATVTVSRVDAFDAFVGTWRWQYGSFVINQNKTGYHAAEFEPCYVNNAAWCRIRDLFQFKMKGASSVSAHYQQRSTVQFSPNGEQQPLPSLYMTDGPAHLTELRLESEHVLRLTELTFGNGTGKSYTYLCRSGASAAEKRRCGI